MYKKNLFSYQIFLIIAICLIYSCSDSVENSHFRGFEKAIDVDKIKVIPSTATGNSITVINFPKEKDTYFDCQKHLTNIRYVPLQTIAASKIGNIDRIYCSNSRIVIIDRKITESVYIFDAKGAFIKRISAKKRLGELRPYDLNHFFCAVYAPSTKEIIMYDDKKDKIYYFDEQGKFLRDQPVYFGFSDFVNLAGTNNFVYLSFYNYNKHVPLLASYNLYFGKDASIFGVAQNNKSIAHIRENFYYEYNLASSGRQAFHTPMFSDTIYEINNNFDKVSPKFKLRFPGGNINDQVRLNPQMDISKFIRLQNNNKYYTFEGKIFSADQLYYVECYKGGTLGYFYSRKNNKLIGGQIKSSQRKTDSLIVEGYSFPIASTGDEFISTINPATYVYIPNMLRTKKLSNALKNFGRNSNPILIFYTLNNI